MFWDFTANFLFGFGIGGLTVCAICLYGIYRDSVQQEKNCRDEQIESKLDLLNERIRVLENRSRRTSH